VSEFSDEDLLSRYVMGMCVVDNPTRPNVALEVAVLVGVDVGIEEDSTGASGLADYPWPFMPCVQTPAFSASFLVTMKSASEKMFLFRGKSRCTKSIRPNFTGFHFQIRFAK
jgi:hypothetical protein